MLNRVSVAVMTVLLWAALTTAEAQDRPIEKLKTLATKTILVQDGQPQASIVMPTDPAGQAAARILQQQIGAKTGCTLPLLGDDEAWETAWGKQNLIVVGNLMTNKVFTMLYCLHYACSDAAWPGEGGYEVRTVCDARGLGQNVVVLGGSDEVGVKTAVDAFLLKVEPGDSLVLDHFIDTRINGKAFTPLSDAELAEQPTNPIKQTQNYYRTGNPQFAALAKRGYLKFAKNMETIGTISFTHPYGWFGICFDLLEEAPVFTDEERLIITNGLVTFMEKAPSHAAPIEERSSPFYGGDMVTIYSYDTGRYFEDYYPQCEIAHKIMDRERIFWSVNSRFWTLQPGSSWYTGHEGPFVLRYAVQELDFEWLETGRLKQWLEWYWASCNNAGLLSGFGDSGWGRVHPIAPWALQVGAWYYKEGWMQWLADHTNTPRRGGYNLGHSFYTGTVKAEPPNHLGDLYRTPLDDWMVQQLKSDVPQARTFNKISIQDGYERGAPYLLLDGISGFTHGHNSTNQIVCFTQNGQYWLNASGYMIRQTLEHNLMGVYRNGLSGSVPPVAELRHFAQVPGGKFVQSVVSGYNGLEWSRSILWRNGGTVLAIDRATARQPGNYGLQLVWRCGPQSVDDVARTVRNEGNGTFYLLNADTSAFGVKATEAGGGALYQSVSKDLDPGQSYTYRNLFFVTDSDKEHSCAIASLDEGAVVIREDQGVSIAGVGPLKPMPKQAEGGLWTDAALFWASAQQICLVDGTRFQAPEILITADKPVSLALDLVQGELTVNPPDDEPVHVSVTLNDEATGIRVPPADKPYRKGALNCATAAEQLTGALEAVWQRQEPVRKQLAGEVGVASPEASLAPQWQITNDQFATFDGSVEKPATPGTNRVRAYDLDADGALEVLVARSDKRLYCLDASGQLRWTFTAPTKVWDVCADDVDGDGKLEVAFVCAPNPSGGKDSFLYLLDSQGKERWHVAGPGGHWRWRADGQASPRTDSSGMALLLCWIGDFNGDGIKEIGCASRNMFLYIHDASGQILWEVTCPWHRPLSWRVADLDSDGVDEFMVATDWATTVFGGDGTTVPDAYFHTTGTVITEGGGSFRISQPGPALDFGDLKGEGVNWIITGSRHGVVSATPYDPGVNSSKPEWSFQTGATVDTVKVVELGGRKCVLAASRNMSVYCFDSDGQVIWTRSLGEMVRCLVAEDFDGDGQPEILVGCDDNRIYQLDATGRVIGKIVLDGPLQLMFSTKRTATRDWDLLASTRDGTLTALRWRAQ